MLTFRIIQTGQLGQIEDVMITGYRVKSGDTLSKIAAKYNTTVAALKAKNNLTSDLILVGQILQLPNGSGNNPQVVPVGAVQPVNAALPVSNNEIPAGSKIKYVASFVGSNITQAGGLVSRWRTVESQRLVKQRFEQAFKSNDVSVTVSDYAGSMEVNFTMNISLPSQTDVRNLCDALIVSARAEISRKGSIDPGAIKSSFIAVTSLGQTIRNSPTDTNQGGGFFDSLLNSDASTALAGGLGLSTPVALLGLGVILVIALKK